MGNNKNTLEEVCGVDNGEDQDGWQVDREDRVKDPASEDNHQLDSLVIVFGIDVVQSPVKKRIPLLCCGFSLPIHNDILGENSIRLHHDGFGKESDHRSLQTSHFKDDGANLH